jgi:hypothetical protein
MWIIGLVAQAIKENGNRPKELSIQSCWEFSNDDGWKTATWPFDAEGDLGVQFRRAGYTHADLTDEPIDCHFRIYTADEITKTTRRWRFVFQFDIGEGFLQHVFCPDLPSFVELFPKLAPLATAINVRSLAESGGISR